MAAREKYCDATAAERREIVDYVVSGTRNDLSGLERWLAGGRRPWALDSTTSVGGPLRAQIAHTATGVQLKRLTPEQWGLRLRWVHYWKATTGWSGSAGATAEQHAAAPPAPDELDAPKVFVHMTWAEIRDEINARAAGPALDDCRSILFELEAA